MGDRGMIVRLKACPCGSTDLKCDNMQVAEDAVETWIECNACGRTSEEVEDAYSDPQGAADQWNRGYFRKPGGEPEHIA